jgi:transposase
MKTDLDVIKYKKMYEGGLSVRALASEAGVSYGTMYTRLREADVSFRPRGSRGIPVTRRRRSRPNA